MRLASDSDVSSGSQEDSYDIISQFWSTKWLGWEQWKQDVTMALVQDIIDLLTQVQDLVGRIEALEETNATLEAQLKTARQSTPSSAKPSPAMPTAAVPAQSPSKGIEKQSPADQVDNHPHA